MHQVFKETQRFTQWWLWAINILVFLLVSLTLYTSLNIETNTNNYSWMLFIWIITLLIPVLFWLMRLETRIDRGGIYIKYVPFLRRSYKWEDIQSFEVINYGFVGGWGIRFGTKYGTVYNVKGNKGLYLILKSGKRVCIGTQQPELLKKMLEKFKVNS
ncbi:hypothetical protein FJ651_14660 [Paucihalobacter ruber]|uniref:Uncharacterized protein n=1 Tax=Paucihalobacter ruber TaxID=2567861 RepID=A0A506PEG7_9FLAO|nr:hypothetical protein [Paucihalobacter ruber]TPV31432.1 hypothetical protein FJ651_14660 [Paucihalobacter ruber]